MILSALVADFELLKKLKVKSSILKIFFQKYFVIIKLVNVSNRAHSMNIIKLVVCVELKCDTLIESLLNIFDFRWIIIRHRVINILT